MPDLYYNWEELTEHEVAGVDYQILSNFRPPSRVSSIAIHGGRREVGTTELAREVAAINSHYFYSLDILPASSPRDLHITSTRYDEPICLQIQNDVEFCISFHGASGNDPKTLMGGRDTVKRDQIMAAIIAAGFDAELASEELNGDSTGNICNKTRTFKGVQLELTTEQRRRFFINRDWDREERLARNFTQEFYDYVNAIAAVTATWEITDKQSANYGLNEATPSDSMADFETWINANWTILEGVPAPPSGTSLPTSGVYVPGDRFYNTTEQSIYICVCNDVDWGLWWRPVQSAVSPWRDLPASALRDPTEFQLNALPSRPVQLMLDNQGMCHWRGVLKWIKTASMPKNDSFYPFKTQPFGFRPRETDFYWMGHQNLDIGSTDWEGVRIYFPDDESDPISVRAQGGGGSSPSLNTFYLNGCVQYAIGAGHYVIP